MLNRNISLFLSIFFLFALINPMKGEIINRSKLIKKKDSFVLIRDLFAPKRTTKERVSRKNLEKKEEFNIKQEKLKRKHEEIFDNIIYEGFVLRRDKNTVLISIDGEFIVCREGETLLDKIEIVKVSLKILTIKIEQKIYDIKIKGDEDEEQ